MEQPKFTEYICELSEPFRRFATMLDNRERAVICFYHDPQGKELGELIKTLKKYAWEKCGVDLLRFGSEGDTSTSLEWYKELLTSLQEKSTG